LLNSSSLSLSVPFQHFSFYLFIVYLVQVIMVDWNPNSVALNRDNALVLKKWEGDNTDRQLIGLAQLLQGLFLDIFFI